MCQNQSEQNLSQCKLAAIIAVGACFLVGLLIMSRGETSSNHSRDDDIRWMQSIPEKPRPEAKSEAVRVPKAPAKPEIKMPGNIPAPVLEEDPTSQYVGSWRNEAVGDVYRIESLNANRLKFTVQSSDALRSCSGVLSRVSSDGRYSGRVTAVFKSDRTKQMRTGPLTLQFYSSRKAAMETDYVVWDQRTGRELRRESVTTFCSR
jgi:hypothetical protein